MHDSSDLQAFSDTDIPIIDFKSAHEAFCKVYPLVDSPNNEDESNNLQIIYTKESEKKVFFHYVLPIAYHLSGGSKRILISDQDHCSYSLIHNAFCLIVLDAASLTCDRMKKICRLDDDEPISRMIEENSMNSLLYIHGYHEAKEDLSFWISSLADGFGLNYLIKNHVIVSSLFDETKGISPNIKVPAGSSVIYLE